MQYLKGTIYLAIGILFMTLRVIKMINFKLIEHFLYAQRRGAELVNGTYTYGDETLILFEYSIVPIILGALLFIIGII